MFHYFVNNVNLGGEKNVPVIIQTRDILTGKNPGTHYYTHVLDNNKVKTSGPVSGAESSRIDSNANADLHNEETKAPSDNSIPKSSENSNTNFAEEDTESQPYSSDDSAYWESMPEYQELLRNAAARDDANPEVTAWGRKQERIETLDRKANNLREAMQENETKARREPGTSL